MYRRIRIEKFKSIARAEFDLGMFTVLVGENGSGKSSVLRALDLLAWSAMENPLTESLARRGLTFEDLVHGRARSEVIRISTWLDAAVESEGTKHADELRYEVGFRQKRGRILVDAESLTISNGEGRSDVGINNREGERSAWDGTRSVEYPEQRGDMESTMLQFVKTHALRLPRLTQVAEQLSSFSHYEIWGPEHLRESSREPPAGRLGNGSIVEPRGENLPHVIRAIRRDKPRYADFLREIRQTFPRLLDVRTIRGLQPQEFGLRFVESSPWNGAEERVVYAPEQVSDGLLRMIALLAIKHQPSPLPCIGYEEPENGLHPSALDDCMRHLKDIARRGTQVIVTTHSPYLLNQILEDGSEPRAELRLVLRDRKGRTTIRPPDPEKIDRARRHGFGIGELWGMLLNERELAKK